MRRSALGRKTPLKRSRAVVDDDGAPRFSTLKRGTLKRKASPAEASREKAPTLKRGHGFKRYEPIPRELRDAVYRRSAGRCIVCGAVAQQVHHVLAKARWPQFYLEARNLVGVCPDCHAAHENASRRIRMSELAAEVAAFAREHAPHELLRYYTWPDSRYAP